MREIKVKTPAKINLALEILGKRPDGFHEIQSIMQAVSLFDVLTITIEDSDKEQIEISGTSSKIPYDKNNIAHKAAKLFLGHAGIENQKVKIYIEKKIPVSAGLAGGSSNAAGVLWGLNKICKNLLSDEDLHFLAAKLGSDVNFCLTGGTCAATSRGEKIKQIVAPYLNFLIIKPSNLAISAKKAYTKYAELTQKPEDKTFNRMKEAASEAEIASLLNNDLEKAVIPAYPEIQEVKNYLLKLGCKNVLMSGSGASVFGIYSGNAEFSVLPANWQAFKVHSIGYGVTAS